MLLLMVVKVVVELMVVQPLMIVIDRLFSLRAPEVAVVDAAAAGDNEFTLSCTLQSRVVARRTGYGRIYILGIGFI